MPINSSFILFPKILPAVPAALPLQIPELAGHFPQLCKPIPFNESHSVYLRILLFFWLHLPVSIKVIFISSSI